MMSTITNDDFNRVLTWTSLSSPIRHLRLLCSFEKSLPSTGYIFNQPFMIFKLLNRGIATLSISPDFMIALKRQAPR